MMLTPEELTALVSLLNRTPMTPGERLWAQSIIVRLEQHEQSNTKLAQTHAERAAQQGDEVET